MRMNTCGGLLVAIDGANGVGKTIFTKEIFDALSAVGIDVWATKSPTDTKLGAFTRQMSEVLYGESLMCLIAADRYQNLSDEIIPRLEDGQVVVTDRYVLSSLIIQCIDGVTPAYILDVHRQALLPDIQIALVADEREIRRRLLQRGFNDRVERADVTNQELELTIRGAKILSDLSVDTHIIDNTNDLEKNVSDVVALIVDYLAHNESTMRL